MFNSVVRLCCHWQKACIYCMYLFLKHGQQPFKMSSLANMEIVDIKSCDVEYKWRLVMKNQTNHFIYHPQPICESDLTFHYDLHSVCNQVVFIYKDRFNLNNFRCCHSVIAWCKYAQTYGDISTIHHVSNSCSVRKLSANFTVWIGATFLRQRWCCIYTVFFMI